MSQHGAKPARHSFPCFPDYHLPISAHNVLLVLLICLTKRLRHEVFANSRFRKRASPPLPPFRLSACLPWD